MNRARSVGMALIIIGGVLISMGYRAHPSRMLLVIAGVLFAVAGTVRVMRSRREPPGA